MNPEVLKRQLADANLRHSFARIDAEVCTKVMEEQRNMLTEERDRRMEFAERLARAERQWNFWFWAFIAVATAALLDSAVLSYALLHAKR